MCVPAVELLPIVSNLKFPVVSPSLGFLSPCELRAKIFTEGGQPGGEGVLGEVDRLTLALNYTDLTPTQPASDSL